ncbi:MAG: DUF3576 domain-containing protein [Pseudomonadota bacterium]
MRTFRRASNAALVLAAAMALASCGHNPDRAAGQPGRESGGGFLGIGKKSKAGDAGAQIGVNSFLWRATLETLSFMPLASADQIGGVVTTDWYANPEASRERFKATVYILDTRLRADGIKVAINRQTLAANGWTDAPSDPEVAIQIENQILVRARELRMSTQG